MPVPDKILYWTDPFSYHYILDKIMRVGVLIHFRFDFLSFFIKQHSVANPQAKLSFSTFKIDRALKSPEIFLFF